MLTARNLRRRIGKIFRSVVVVYYRQMGIKIGKNVFISMGAWLDVRRGHIVIGDYAAITSGCKILSHDRTLGLLGKSKRGPQTTIIGQRVFIGMNSIILPGVKIGDRSIIGAGSVISKNVPEGCVVVSSKAHIVKRLNKSSGKWESADEML